MILQLLRPTRTVWVVCPGVKVKVPDAATYSLSHEVPAAAVALAVAYETVTVDCPGALSVTGTST